ncbi:glucose-6-phosphate isomerase [Algiphilus sp.]|uniref:glucose-6-phosphate isomerase n=1 Tax=Algiphilus sp. TaxID=1872431 RepID=UPI0025B911ED|nr:glucose-6-phosphate isomerase [Algiphilus sp.]MCK5769599.1 glucose-6-phosphate isomerase [Algiphilus sp.]
MPPVPERDDALRAARDALAARSLLDLFADDTGRAERYRLHAAGITYSYAKQRLDDAAMRALLDFASGVGLEGRIAALFAGEAVNNTENRAALHMALRAPAGEAWRARGEIVDGEVVATRERFLDFAEAVRDGRIAAADGGAFTDVVNIGIGGSDLGPRMVCAAMAARADGPRTHFIANVDAAEREAVLARCDPARTLVIVTSKTFTTQETMANARSTRRWLVDALGEAAVSAQFAAVSTNVDGAGAFGVDPDRVFGFWDWVGGRYSLWSAVGLPIALAIGRAGFEALMAGARAMDAHFRDAPPAENLPVLMGLVGVWNRNLLGGESQVVVPYAQRLVHFVGWLQQLEMESNGKAVTRDGRPVSGATTPALWGDVGTNAQHAFFQMLHQGPVAHPVDFIAVLRADHDDAEQQRLLLANCFAQSAALMRGRDVATVEAELQAGGMTEAEARAAAPHRVFSGNRPSATLLLARLDAHHLGALLAAYEHRTYVQSVLWGINAFDQWGVELGKRLARDVDALLQGGADEAGSMDPDTAALVQLALKQAR